MKKYFLNVYEKVLVEKFSSISSSVWLLERYVEISGVDFVEIFQKNGQKSMKNGRFGSVFLHVSHKMIPLLDPTCDYCNLALYAALWISGVVFKAEC